MEVYASSSHDWFLVRTPTADPGLKPLSPLSSPSSNLIVKKMGKVHGSLARAGKVKSQTPKVEKQEKKKTPKGRAKKRILYNRRFVNVTTLPGGKRRMNPNPEK
ncbi:ribosomal protein S30-domain-containing protein [Amylostereum chailletii]|nr:ribosomal protein S30-domain-containing protein [Amylostereum chailletii]